MQARQSAQESQQAECPLQWRALYTKHQHEKSIARILSCEGYDAFLPLYQDAHRWQDRVKRLWLPLFPCYVFLRSGDRIPVQVLRTPGLHAVVGGTACPAVVPASDIEAIRRIVTCGLPAAPHPWLKCGDRVRVTRGPLRDLEGILVRKKNLLRLVIAVEILGRAACVEVDATWLERLGSSTRPELSGPRIPQLSAIA